MNSSNKSFYFVLILAQFTLLNSCANQNKFDLEILKESEKYFIAQLPNELKGEHTFVVIDQDLNLEYIGQKWNDNSILILKQGSDISENAKILRADIENTKLQVSETNEELSISFEDNLVAKFHKALKLLGGIEPEFARNGFVHPFTSPEGMILTDDFPVDHRHQHGIFGALTFTTYQGDTLDFWNQIKKSGNVHLEELVSIYNGPLFAEISAKMHYTRFNSPEVPILEEGWTVRFFAEADHHVIFIDSEISNVTEDILFAEKYHYGGLGWRGPKEWNGSDSINFEAEMKVITSEGLEKPEANHTSPDWLSSYGNIGDKEGGVLAFSQAESFRFPSKVRVHPSMPYFTFAPMVSGKYSIEKGNPIRTGYVFITYDGSMREKFLERLYSEYFMVDPTN
jgi:hypothetical protein